MNMYKKYMSTDQNARQICMCNEYVPSSMHSTLWICYSFAALEGWLTRHVRTGEVGAHSARHIPSFVSFVNMLAMLLIVIKLHLVNKSDKKMSKNCSKKLAISLITTGRFGQTNITWPESSKSDLYANMWFYLGICGNRKLCFTQCRKITLRTKFWYLSL